jgi:hypothetical protein
MTRNGFVVFHQEIGHICPRTRFERFDLKHFSSIKWGLISLLPATALVLPLLFQIHTLSSEIRYDSYLILFMFFPALLLLGLCSLLFTVFTWKAKSPSKYRWAWAFSWSPFALLVLFFALVVNEGGSLMFPLLGLAGIIPFLALPVHWYFLFYNQPAQ